MEMYYNAAKKALRKYQGNRSISMAIAANTLTDFHDKPYNPANYSIFNNPYVPKRIIYNDPATIIFWADGTKTVVKRSEGEPFNKYHAFCAAFTKKFLGNNSRVNAIVNSGIEQKKKEKKK